MPASYRVEVPVPARVVVLVSGSGTLLQALLDAAAEPEYPARVVGVAADRPGIEGLARAERAGVPAFHLRLADFADRAAWDAALAKAVAEHQPDLVVSAGFMKILGPAFREAIGAPLINTHPALLPAFPGTHGPGRRAGLRREGHRRHRAPRRRRRGHRPGARPGRRARRAGRRPPTRLHERIKIEERRLLVSDRRRAGPPRGHRQRTRGDHPVSKSQKPSAGPSSAPWSASTTRPASLELATGLHALGVEVVSTGSTARLIADAGVPVTAVEQLTGLPASAWTGGSRRLHPRVHAGLLADTRKPEHLAQLAELGIAPFELLVTNLYPFTATVASGATPDECVEQIDIGGPAMVRASAKNHDSVAVVVDPSRYDWVLESVKDGGFTLADRRALAVAAFRHTATYDVAVASYLGSVVAPDGNPFPGWVGATWDRSATLRYGENPHQAAALYASGAPGLAVAEQLSGKEMSYNNYVDADAAWRAAHDHGDVPCVAVIKHANPCGIAVGADVAEAHRKAHATDPISAFGGVIAVNGEVSVELAEQVAEIFTEVVVAPAYAEGASAVLARKRNLRVLRLPVAPPRARRGAAPGLRRAAAAAARRPRRPRRRPDHLDARHRRPRGRRRARRSRLRLAGLPVGEVERDPAGRRRGRGRRRDGPGQPGGRRAARGGAGGRSRAGFGGRVGRVLPVPGRVAGAARRRGARGRAAGRLGARPALGRGRRGRGVPMYLTGTRHFAH